MFKATVDEGTSMAVKATLRGFTWESPRYFAQVVTPGDCEQECQILAVLKHPNIVGLLGDLTALIICRIAGGSLPSMLRLPSLHLITTPSIQGYRVFWGYFASLQLVLGGALGVPGMPKL